MTDEQIAEGLRLAGEATPGPWVVSDYGAYIFGPQDAMVADDCHHCAGFRIRGYGGGLPQEQNAKWIAHAGTHYAVALREVQALRQQVQDALACIEPRCVEEREVIQGYVTRDMAADAGEPMMEGEAVMGVETIEHEEWIELAAILRGTR